MKPEPGYYSIVQYVPSPERGEGVNIGVLLFSPAHRFIRAQFTANFQRPKRLFARDGLFDAEHLKHSRIALEQRLHNDADSFRTGADLESFVASRATDLRLTEPRAIKVYEPDRELAELFEEVVGGTQAKSIPGPLFPELDGFFAKLNEQGRARLNEPVRIPILERDIRIPYVYQNGVQNLVLPRRFPAKEKGAMDAASVLAIEGDLLQRHPVSDGERKLIVASDFPEDAEPSLAERVRRALHEYRVEMIASDQLYTFIRRVQREAHAA
jgi:hypothetical protein